MLCSVQRDDLMDLTLMECKASFRTISQSLLSKFLLINERLTARQIVTFLYLSLDLSIVHCPEDYMELTC